MFREERSGGQTQFSEEDFKVCDLCGALNRAANSECFVCGWYGAFHRDPEVVREAIREFQERYGGLNEVLLAEEILPDEGSGPGWFSTLFEKIKLFLRGRGAAGE